MVPMTSPVAFGILCLASLPILDATNGCFQVGSRLSVVTLLFQLTIKFQIIVTVKTGTDMLLPIGVAFNMGGTWSKGTSQMQDARSLSTSRRQPCLWEHVPKWPAEDAVRFENKKFSIRLSKVTKLSYLTFLFFKRNTQNLTFLFS